jgi:hypothetical protein
MTCGTRICPIGGAMAAGAMLDMSVTTVGSTPPPTMRKVSFGVSIFGSALSSVAAMTVAMGGGGVAVHVVGVREAELGATTTYWPGLTMIVWPPDVSVTEPACPIFASPTCR